jgi:hypothetical protein
MAKYSYSKNGVASLACDSRHLDQKRSAFLSWIAGSSPAMTTNVGGDPRKSTLQVNRLDLPAGSIFLPVTKLKAGGEFS